MNNSQKFKSAHQVARAIVEYVGDYKIALSIALKQVNKIIKQGGNAAFITRWSIRTKIKFDLELHGYASVCSSATKSGKAVEKFQFESVSKFNEVKCAIGNMGDWFECDGVVFAYRYK